MRHRWVGWTFAVVVATLLVAGCASSEGGSGSASTVTSSPTGTGGPTSGEPTSTTTATTAAATAPATSAELRAVAVGALLAGGDLQGSWTRDVANARLGPSASETFLDLPACAALVPDASAGAPPLGSAQALYEPSGGGPYATHQVDIYADEVDAAQVVSLFQAPDLAPCIEAVVEAEWDGSVTIELDSATSLALDPAALGVDDAVGVAVTGTMSQGPTTGSMQRHVVLLRSGAALSVVTVDLNDDQFVTTALQTDDAAIAAAARKVAAVPSAAADPAPAAEPPRRFVDSIPVAADLGDPGWTTRTGTADQLSSAMQLMGPCPAGPRGRPVGSLDARVDHAEGLKATYQVARYPSAPDVAASLAVLEDPVAR